MSQNMQTGQCVACGHRPINYLEGFPPLCVTGKLVPHDAALDVNLSPSPASEEIVEKLKSRARTRSFEPELTIEGKAAALIEQQAAENASLSSRIEEAARVIEAAAGIKWRSADKDNMEFTATITYSQMDKLRAAARWIGKRGEGR